MILGKHVVFAVAHNTINNTFTDLIALSEFYTINNYKFILLACFRSVLRSIVVTLVDRAVERRGVTRLPSIRGCVVPALTC